MNNDITPLQEKDTEVIKKFLMAHWGSTEMVRKGQKYDVSMQPGFIVWENDKIIGLITYAIKNNECEIGIVDSLVTGKGIGTKLIEKVIEIAKKHHCKRVWLITTNDNTNALKFYQKRGFHLVALYPDALELSRKLKPEIPLVGNDEIPLRDEIELEIKL